MAENVILVKKGDETSTMRRPGKLYRLMIKSPHMETIIAELEPHAESRAFQHEGEEMHLVLRGELEYTVGEKSYKLNEGDILWHDSKLKHRAKNSTSEKVVYITIGTPPTFQWSMT
jgi:mannose-6-phosphate isomerase-like protein (cupin superfamily)